MKNILIFVFGLAAFYLLITADCFSKQSGGVFLELPSSARAGGMAECFAALSDEPLGIYYNPAGVSFSGAPAVSFLHQIYLQDISGEYLGVAYPAGDFTFCAAPSCYGMKKEPVYDSNGFDTGKEFGYGATILPVAVSYSAENLSIGTVAKYYFEKIDDYSRDAVTFDYGVIYKFNRFRAGVAGLNLINSINGYKLPRTIKSGASYIYRGFIISAEFDRQLVDEENVFGFGGEIPLAKIFFLRGGYRIKSACSGPAAGLGIKLGNTNIDYAFSSYDQLGATHRIGISFSLLPEKMGE